jgi:hypothetical protein
VYTYQKRLVGMMEEYGKRVRRVLFWTCMCL